MKSHLSHAPHLVSCINTLYHWLADAALAKDNFASTSAASRIPQEVVDGIMEETDELTMGIRGKTGGGRGPLVGAESNR
jgi:hypothetical protein